MSSAQYSKKTMTRSTFSSSVAIFSRMVSTNNAMSSTFTASAALWPPSAVWKGIRLTLSLFSPFWRLCKMYTNILRKSNNTMACGWMEFTFNRWNCWAHTSRTGRRVWNCARSKPTEDGFCLCSWNGALGLDTIEVISFNSWESAEDNF